MFENLKLWWEANRSGLGKEYKIWRKAVKGIEMVNMQTGAGYYLPFGFIFSSVKKGYIKEFNMNSGKVGIYKLLDYERYRDPDDMTKSANWMLIGYKGEKPIAECTWQEFKEIYVTVWKGL